MMASNTSGKFFVGSLITFAILFGLIQVILSNSKSAAKHVTEPESMEVQDIEARIKPVAEVTVGEPPVIEAPAVSETIDVATGPGAEIVTQVCAACHAAGLMQSPKLANADDWAPRIEKGIETLYKHAIEGFNMMPAKGGRTDLSDDEIKAAVDHMVQQAQ